MGVSGRLGIRRAECEDAREDGREMGRLVGVKKRNGTPATSSRCLCMRSRTCCSSCRTVSGAHGDKFHSTHHVFIYTDIMRFEERLEFLFVLMIEQADYLGNERRGDASEFVAFRIAVVAVGGLVLASYGGELGASVREARRGEC